MLVAEADLGERVMRALILRRVALLQSEIGGPLLIRAAINPDVMRLKPFFSAMDTRITLSTRLWILRLHLLSPSPR